MKCRSQHPPSSECLVKNRPLDSQQRDKGGTEYGCGYRHRGVAIRLESRCRYADAGAMPRIAASCASISDCEASFSCVGFHKARGERMTCLDDSFKPRAMV